MNELIISHHTDFEALCRRYGVQRLMVFGSAARDDFDPDYSDVDFLVNFSNPLTPGYADRYFDFANELEALLGRKVDLVTEHSVINPVFKQRIQADAVQLYAA